MFDEYKKRLEVQKEAYLFRDPSVILNRQGKYVDIGSKRLINFSSNDYLGLSSDQRLKKIVAKNFEKYPVSSSSSRLVCGNYSITLDMEKKFAKYFGFEDCLFFQTGFQANLALMSTLFLKNQTVLVDKHVHASTVSGLRLGNINFKTFKHNNLPHLEKRLKSKIYSSCWVITESLFSMDGDLLNVDLLLNLKKKYGFKCIVDEAHAVGAMGEKGRGIASDVSDIMVGTFGKAFGFFGAFILLPSVLKEYMFNFATALIYSTALPPAHAACVGDILNLIQELEDRRWHLKELSKFTRQRLKEIGIKFTGDSYILGIFIGDEGRAKKVSNELINKGYLVFSARYPTVPLSKAILRLSLCYFHTEKDIIRFISHLKDVLYKNGILQ